MARRINPIDLMPVSRHPRRTRALLEFLAGAVLAFLYIPIVFLVLFSFEESSTPGLPITGLTLHWYEALLKDELIQRAVLNSIIVAAAVAVIATVVGTMAAFPLVRARLRFADSARLLFTMPIMIPGVLLGIGLLLTFRRVADLELSLMTVIAGHLVFTVPFVVLIVSARLQGFDRRLEWAAADLGAGPGRTLRHVVLPLISPAILAGALMSVTLSIDEFVITFFTVGPQVTLPLYIYTQIKFGVTPEVNAVATIMLAGTLIAIIAGSLLMSSTRRFRRRGPR